MSARLARALFDHAVAAFGVVPGDARAPGLEAIDRFLGAPAPSTFLGAVRVLGGLRRRFLIETAAGTTTRRAFADGVAALRAVPGLPPELVERITSDLPLDGRAGRRLQALAALATAYEELASRVAAASDEMRRRLRASAPRRGGNRR